MVCMWRLSQSFVTCQMKEDMWLSLPGNNLIHIGFVLWSVKGGLVVENMEISAGASSTQYRFVTESTQSVVDGS